MALDVGVFDKLKTFQDYQRAEDEFQIKRQLAAAQMQRAMTGASLPAALQLANEYQRRVASGDVNGANLIAQFAKTADKGLVIDEDGNYQAAPGYAPAIAGIEGAKAGSKEQAQANVKAVMDPVIAEDVANAKNTSELNYAAPIKKAEAFGKEMGDRAGTLNSMEASLPQLEMTTQKLSQLGKTATYTTAGRALNTATREAGLPVSEGAKARAEYISTVDNQILPLLRQTFGAQFTQKEGESLRATLGNPNLSPEEKDSVLNGFIEQKKATIGSLQREVGAAPKSPVNLYPKDGAPPAANAAPKIANGTIADNPQTGKSMVFMNGTWKPLEGSK